MKILMTTLVALASVVALPAAAFAATYQYISSGGDVMTVIAPNADTAIMTAPGIAATSGVMLVNDMDNALPSGMDVPLDPTPPTTQ